MKYFNFFLFMSLILSSVGMCEVPAANENKVISSIQGKAYPYDEAITAEDIVKFLDALKEAIELNDPEKFSNLVLPSGGNYISLRNRKAIPCTKKNVIKYYKKIVTETLKKIIRDANLDNIIATSYGFGIGNGALWFVLGKHRGDGIITLNLDHL